MKKISEVEIPILVKVSIEVNIVSINQEKENTTTENNVFLKQNSDYKLNDPIDLSVEGNVVIEGKL